MASITFNGTMNLFPLFIIVDISGCIAFKKPSSRKTVWSKNTL